MLTEEDKQIIRDRLLQKAGKTKSGCWEAPSQRSKRYGKLSFGGRSYSLHRLSAWVFNGFDIYVDLCVCHRCDNKRCFNPSHLFVGTVQDNVDDKIAKGRHAHGTKVNTAKLDPDAVIRIYKMVIAGATIEGIAARLGVTFSQVARAAAGKSWKEVAEANPELACLSKERLGSNQRKSVRCKETGQIFRTIAAAADSCGVSRQCVADVCYGRQTTAGGLTWEFV